MTASINRVAVVGCGLIGSEWASWFLAQGLEVTCTDSAPGIEQRLRDNIVANLAQLGFSGTDQEELLSRFHFEAVLERAVVEAQWVQESVPEDFTLKHAILARIDQATGAEIVIASSTSSLKITDLQMGLSRPERVVAGHPFLPVTLIPLVEVAGGTQTSPAAIDTAMAFYRRIGKQPIRLNKEVTGHIANRLQAAVMREAFFLLQEGVASAPDIDLAITEGPGPRWAATGPFVSQQLAGGAGGARQAFANLGEALNNMWADLGSPNLTPELKKQVIAGAQECLADKSQAEWADARRRLVRAIQLEKADIEQERMSR